MNAGFYVISGKIELVFDTRYPDFQGVFEV